MTILPPDAEETIREHLSRGLTAEQVISAGRHAASSDPPADAHKFLTEFVAVVRRVEAEMRAQ